MTIRDIVAAGGTSLFSAVTAASPIGNAGRNILRAKGIQNLDMSITKGVKIRESMNLQYRCEFYNSTNTRNYGIPKRASTRAPSASKATPTAATAASSWACA